MNQRPKLMVLDTETTGLSVEDGDRLIEIGVVELEGLTPTGRTFHTYLNPGERQILAGATQVHGITNEMLAKAPAFGDIVDDFLDFIGDEELVIYNAAFDAGFINAELDRIGRAALANPIIDALEVVRKRFPRKRHTLDSIAKRLGIDTSARELHGALIDARILGEVYRRLTQQDELAIAAVEEVAASTSIRAADAKPVLRAASAGVLTLPRCESSYTLFGSALKADTIPGLAKKAGYEAVALVDRNTTAGAMAFAEAAKRAEIKAIVGAALPISTSEGRPIVLYARNETGWKNIQKLVTLANVDNRGRGLTSDQLRNHAEGIAATCGGADGAIAHLLRVKGAETALKTARFLSALFAGAFAMEIDRHGGAPDPAVEAAITTIAHELGVPVIGTSIARAAPGHADLVEVIRAIGSGHEYQPDMTDEEDLRDPARMTALFRDLPNAVNNANWIATLCDFAPAGAKPMLPRYGKKDESEEDALRAMAEDGLSQRLQSVPVDEHPRYRERFEYEMDLICRLGFAGYFLIVADFIAWARTRGIPVGPGRGSGAGSIVAWSVGITSLDPIKLKLLFERFINPDRVSLPDFDVDFCEERRGEVIRYVREKYGADRVVAIGAYGTIKAKLAIKDVGRVMGLPYGQMDRISKAIPNGEELTEETVQKEEIQNLLTTPASREAFGIARRLQGLIRSKSRHPAGIIIADRPVNEITALEPDSDDPDQSVTQYDMKPVEKAGLVKFDFLGLKTLTVIERTRQNLKALGIDIDPYAAPLDDKRTYDELSRGNTVGVFQLESDGITRACREIRVDNFEDVIAIVSLYRPGPMEFIPLYARRKKGLEPFGTPHPLLDDVTRDTFGILVYQEQVMQAAQVLAGYTLGQADLLRRAMGKKIQEEMDKQRGEFIKGCRETNGIPEAQANALFDIIDKFAGYGFNRSHAAAYALLSYITAYLRTHYPAAYLAAALDGAVNDGDTDQAVRLAHEARRHGIALLSPRPTPEGRYFQAIDEKTIRWSLTGIKGIGKAVVDAIVAAAGERPFADLHDLVSRIGDSVNRGQAERLAAAGVFDEICGNRAEAIAMVRENFEGMANEAKARRQGQQSLFDDEMPRDGTPAELENKEILDLERQALGLTLSAHPLDEHVRSLADQGILTPSAAEPLLDIAPVAIAALVDEVRIGKNRNAWMTVRVSDEKATITLGCQEDLKGANLLQTGEILILRISGQISGGERRLRIDEIVGRIDRDCGKTIDVQASSAFNRDAMRRVLAQAPPGPDRVRITIGEDVLVTPPVVEADEALVAAIKTVDGVEFAAL